MYKINEKLTRVTARLRIAAQNANRNPEEIALIAASKGQGVAQIKAVYAGGQRLFGENYLQEALEKQGQLHALSDIQWHFLGPIQSNKTRAIATHFAWAHSLDRYKIAKRLSEQRPHTLPPLQVCIQVNIDDEINKAGVSCSELDTLATQIDALPNIQLRGLMAIPAKSNNAEQQKTAFNRLALALKMLRTGTRQGPLDTLSMGMSKDLEVAISAGATMIRVGTDIFGPRLTPSNAQPEDTQ